MRRLADAVATGAIDIEAAREKTLELREKRERASKRLVAVRSRAGFGAELQNALSVIESDLASVLNGMDRLQLQDLVRLVFKRFSVEAQGGPRNRTGRITSHEFRSDFQDFWITHSKRMVGDSGLEPETFSV